MWKTLPKVNNDELKAIVESDTSQTTRELESKFDVFIPTILDHLRQINIKCTPDENPAQNQTFIKRSSWLLLGGVATV